MQEWTEQQRHAAKAFLAEAMPIPQFQRSAKIEVDMPGSWRRGFDTVFALLKPPALSELSLAELCVLYDEVRHRLRELELSGEAPASR